jgi:formiminoglutamase
MWAKYEIPQNYLLLRPEDPKFKRWAHLVKNADPRAPKAVGSKNTVLLWGYACDKGVEANFGRLGSKTGPQSIREALYRLPAVDQELEILDFGDFSEDNLTLIDLHQQARSMLLPLVKSKALSISLGGGHDWAAVDFDWKDLQVVHVDAHLDVRPFRENEAHSGMPFRYLVQRGVKVFALGIQKEFNSREHFDWAQKKFSALWALDDLEKVSVAEIVKSLDFTHPVALSLDMDAFAQSVSPGVSAPSPRGVSVEYVAALIDALRGKLLHMGIYELNPSFDRDAQSARLAAYFISRLCSI